MTVRIRILQILWRKEWLRLWKQPMAILLLGLLASICILIATGGTDLNRSANPTTPLCWVSYTAEVDPQWMTYLQEKLPEHPPLRMVSADQMQKTSAGTNFLYPDGFCGIELSRLSNGQTQIVFRHPGARPDTMFAHSQWFWSTTMDYYRATPSFQILAFPVGATSHQSPKEALRQTSISDLMTVELIGSMLIFAAHFFCCVHLLISFSSQDRERGTLLALVLTPASVPEILVARCLFHGCLSLIMSLMIIAILKPAALAVPLLWGTLIVTSIGFMSVGIVLSSLAKTQATAALLTLCYMLGTALVFHLSTGFPAFAAVRNLMFEHRSFPLVFVGLKSGLGGLAWNKFVNLCVLVAGWTVIAVNVFARRGWR